jgi:hypothetical protein
MADQPTSVSRGQVDQGICASGYRASITTALMSRLRRDKSRSMSEAMFLPIFVSFRHNAGNFRHVTGIRQ